MKRFIRNLGMRINFMQWSWWIFWESKFFKLHMHRAFDICRHNWKIANQNLELYDYATFNW